MAAAVPARAVAVVGYRPDELAAAGDVLGFVGHLLGADDDLLVHGLLDGLGREDRLLQQGAVGIINILQRHEADAVLALLQGLGGALGVIAGLGGLGAEGDLLLPGLHLGDPHLQRRFLLGHDEGIAFLNVRCLGQGCPLEVGVQGTQFAEGQVIFLGDGPQGVAGLDRVGLFLLADTGDQILDGVVVLEAVVEVDAVFQRDGLVEADRHVLVVLVLLFVGADHIVQVGAQRVAIGADCGELAVQIQGRALADLVAGALQNGVGGLALVHHLMGDGDGVGRLNGPIGLIGARVIDTLHHVVTGEVEDRFVGHIADGPAVDLHRQRIGLADGVVEDGQEHRQHTDRQDVHGHPGQQFAVAPDAAGKVVGAGLERRAEALLFPDIVGVHQQRADAPEEEQDGAEQLPEHLGRAGESGDGHLMQHIADAVPQP